MVVLGSHLLPCRSLRCILPGSAHGRPPHKGVAWSSVGLSRLEVVYMAVPLLFQVPRGPTGAAVCGFLQLGRVFRSF